MKRSRVSVVLEVGESLTLGARESRHLRDVLRLGVGAAIELYDAEGRSAIAEIVSLRPEIVVVVVEILPAVPARELFLLLAVTKGPAMDLAIRMAVETGVTRILPFHAVHSVPKAGKIERWERIAESAVQQCRRTDRPVIDAVTSLTQILAEIPDAHEKRVAHFEGPPIEPACGPASVMIGPEGGLADREVQAAYEAGFQPYTLGPWVLRVPTAVAVACAMTLPRP